MHTEGQSLQFDERNDRIIVGDGTDRFRKSLLRSKEERFGGNEVGREAWEREFADDWLAVGDHSLKIKSLKISFDIPSDLQSRIETDLTRHVLTVMEYFDRIISETNRFADYRDGGRVPVPDDEA